jgi:alpha-L-arabinofuranosidase
MAAGRRSGVRREFLFGTDEFLFLARHLGAEPVITLSIYDPDTGDFATDDVIAAAVAWCAT